MSAGELEGQLTIPEAEALLSLRRKDRLSLRDKRVRTVTLTAAVYESGTIRVHASDSRGNQRAFAPTELIYDGRMEGGENEAISAWLEALGHQLRTRWREGLPLVL